MSSLVLADLGPYSTKIDFSFVLYVYISPIYPPILAYPGPSLWSPVEPLMGSLVGVRDSRTGYFIPGCVGFWVWTDLDCCRRCRRCRRRRRRLLSSLGWGPLGWGGGHWGGGHWGDDFMRFY